MRPLQNSPKFPKCLSRNLGDFGEFCKGLGFFSETHFVRFQTTFIFIHPLMNYVVCWVFSALSIIDCIFSFNNPLNSSNWEIFLEVIKKSIKLRSSFALPEAFWTVWLVFYDTTVKHFCLFVKWVYVFILKWTHDCDGVCVSFHEFEKVCMLDKERTRMLTCI